MQRRTFILQSLTALAGFSALGIGALAPPARAAVGDWQRQFLQALDSEPRLLGYLGLAQETLAAKAEVRGNWPSTLRGRLYRNGPGVHALGGWRYHHWFDGDGLMQCWQLGPEGVEHKARVVETHKWRREREAGQRLLPAFGSAPPDAVGVTGPDDLNAANISVLHWQDRLHALWEAGSAWELDPETLQAQGPRAWSEEAEGLPFSAHPRIDADGHLWNFGYVNHADLLVLWHLSPEGRTRTRVLPVSNLGMPHDFMVTRRHLVVPLPPLWHDPSADQADHFLATQRWHPEAALRVLVIDKENLTLQRTHELPAQWIFHYGNAWEDAAGVIRFDGAAAEGPELMTEGFRELMRGRVVTGLPMHQPWLYELRPDGDAKARLLDASLETEFPAVLPELTGKRYEVLYSLGSTAGSDASAAAGLQALWRFDLDGGVHQSWRYPDTEIPEEHLPVRDADGETWVIGTSLDWQRGRTRLRVFAADRVEAGPVTTATLPYPVPLGLHGQFVGARADG